MSKLFHVTYEIVTPESAEDGDAAERGFYHENGGRDPLELVPMGADDYAMDLRTALRLCDPSEDCGTWFTSYPYCEDYRTGAELSTSLHPPRNVTRSSYGRLQRLLKLARAPSFD